jgi:predicted ribosomally synthesized peptide with SipW-like signal peptide
MKKSIILSLVMVVAIAAGVIGATKAFFSDTETSTGNTFAAGAIDLKVDSQCSYNGVATNQNCVGNWGQANNANPLGGIDITGQQFFNFSDIKPGDFGENTISLHVDNNPAWACATIAVKSDDDVTCTEPETGDDPVCNTALGMFNGDIAKNLSLAWWADDGDNILEAGEPVFYLNGKKLSELLAYGGVDNRDLHLTLADSQTNFFNGVNGTGNTIALDGSHPYYIGMQWCFGDMTIDGTTITCNGQSVNNASQSDSMTADISFSVIQSRNNAGFKCEDTYIKS